MKVLGVILFLLILAGVSYSKDKEIPNIHLQESLSIIHPLTAYESMVESSHEYSYESYEWCIPQEGFFTPGLGDAADNINIESQGESYTESQGESNTVVEALYKTHGFNKAVENSIYFFSNKIKERFGRSLSRSGKYLSMMTEIFSEKGLPKELVFLPLIESGFNMYAYSPKRAAGLWQFIASTGKKYGLKIDWWVDERRDPIKATVAAAEYLSDLYDMFGSWNLALAAYNGGEGRILRALNKTKTNDFWTLRGTKHIRKETKDYVPFYIAATAIAVDPEGFGFQDVSYHEPLTYDEVVIDSPMDIKAIAGYAEVDVKQIQELNPELKRWSTPPNVLSYTLRLPFGTKERFLANISNDTDERKFSIDYYTVKKGDTVKKIAKRFAISSEAIFELNSFSKNSQLKAGSTILIPPKEFAHLTKDIKNKKTITKHKKLKRASKKSKKPYLVTSNEKKRETPHMLID